MRDLPQWAIDLLSTPRETQAVNLAMATADPAEATALVFRLHLLNAYVRAMHQNPTSLEDPLLRLMVGLSDDRRYSLMNDDLTWAALFTVLRDNGPREFVAWIDHHRDRFYLEDFGEIAAFAYEGPNGEIVDRFPGLIDKAQDLGSYSQRASAQFAATRSSTETKGGCYVATYVYGSYDSPELWVLRRWRDEYLARTVAGRAFIFVYYLVSPKLIRHAGDNRAFVLLSGHAVHCLVDLLQRAGVSNERYEDR